MSSKYEIVAIGVTRGGAQALELLALGLPASFPLPVVVVEHPDGATARALLARLQAHSALPVQEVEDKAPIVGGNIYFAPFDYHLMVQRGSFALSTEAALSGERPSIDILFETVAEAYGSNAVAVLLAGNEPDGELGLERIRKKGGLAVVQTPTSSPSGRVAPADRVLHLSDIASFLTACPEPTESRL
jgi:two-component system chemotaxis response regulator CheB